MGITHNPDHTADVRTILGIKATGDSNLGGIEIETGWTSEAKRTSFFKQLEKKGYGDLCISKHDGTIGNRGEVYPAEIVSAPLPLPELRKFANAVGEAIESHADKGLVTSGCGVHIHLSEGLFTQDALWRYAAAFCQNPVSIATWLNISTTGPGIAPLAKNSNEVNAFWDDLCLRGETGHSKRTPYKKVSEIPTTKAHTRAFIHGNHTPTYETRIFRTPKSRTVLASYVDMVESLHSYSMVAADDFLEPPGSINQELVRKLEKEVCPLLSIGVTSGRSYVYHPLSGQQFDISDVVTYSIDGRSYYYPSKSQSEKLGKRCPSMEEATLIVRNSYLKNARGWKDGTINPKNFIQFVIESDKFPALAKRFGYEKFARYIDGIKEVEYVHRTAPHDSYMQGCLVRLEYGHGDLYELIERSQQKDNFNIEQWILKEQLSGVTSLVPVNTFIHACKGATCIGGEI